MTRRSSHGAKEELPVGQAEACKRQAVCLGHVILHVRDGTAKVWPWLGRVPQCQLSPWTCWAEITSEYLPLVSRKTGKTMKKRRPPHPAHARYGRSRRFAQDTEWVR